MKLSLEATPYGVIFRDSSTDPDALSFYINRRENDIFANYRPVNGHKVWTSTHTAQDGISGFRAQRAWH